jgi:hypothetical protein
LSPFSMMFYSVFRFRSLYASVYVHQKSSVGLLI